MMFDCPFCTYEKEVPDSYDGKKIKCPRCMATLTLGVPQPTELTALPLPEDDVSPLEQTAIEVGKTESLIECPFCYELIDSYSIVCPCCHQNINLDQPNPAIKPLANRGEIAQFSWICGLAGLVGGVGLICGPLAVGGGFFAKKGELKRQEQEKANAAIFLGIVGTAASLLLIVSLIGGSG